MKRVAIVQSNYIPWKGYFDLINAVDEFILFDDVQYTRRDWRNRNKWPEYEWAVNDMVDRTSTEHAPWTLVEAEDKRYARIKVLKTIVQRLEAIL